jgi:hypothetical protein
MGIKQDIKKNTALAATFAVAVSGSYMAGGWNARRRLAAQEDELAVLRQTSEEGVKALQSAQNIRVIKDKRIAEVTELYQTEREYCQRAIERISFDFSKRFKDIKQLCTEAQEGTPLLQNKARDNLCWRWSKNDYAPMPRPTKYRF